MRIGALRYIEAADAAPQQQMCCTLHICLRTYMRLQDPLPSALFGHYMPRDEENTYMAAQDITVINTKYVTAKTRPNIAMVILRRSSNDEMTIFAAP